MKPEALEARDVAAAFPTHVSILLSLDTSISLIQQAHIEKLHSTHLCQTRCVWLSPRELAF